MVTNLGETYQKMEREHQIPPYDFLSLGNMWELRQTQDFSKFPASKRKLDMLANDITQLMVILRQEESLLCSQAVKGGAFDDTMNRLFGHHYGEGLAQALVTSSR